MLQCKSFTTVKQYYHSEIGQLKAHFAPRGLLSPQPPNPITVNMSMLFSNWPVSVHLGSLCPNNHISFPVGTAAERERGGREGDREGEGGRREREKDRDFTWGSSFRGKNSIAKDCHKGVAFISVTCINQLTAEAQYQIAEPAVSKDCVWHSVFTSWSDRSRPHCYRQRCLSCLAFCPVTRSQGTCLPPQRQCCMLGDRHKLPTISSQGQPTYRQWIQHYCGKWQISMCKSR